MSDLQAEVVKAWEDDAELSKTKQMVIDMQAQLELLKRKMHEREDTIVSQVKQRLGITETLTDFECMLGESRYGIH